ncbi:AsnC family transcriptional regulator [Thermococcus sp. P6]|uniref:Lrp/AsnC family transcriptional regulator n=1 Tax=Thermococcus sp. P6 TaxID=122420 RepID=UPI000B59E267|nr:Lrp/AsnC ligand binding domain-containing protein [Thermococcus sp. P6]ASJ11319.1 AsnC family transcriptional regulator [Thermococcus sp. P6]
MVTAFILMVTAAGKEREVMEKLLAMPEVKEAHVVYGEYDVVIKVETDTLKALDQFITEKIRKMPEIQMTSTMIAI